MKRKRKARCGEIRGIGFLVFGVVASWMGGCGNSGAGDDASPGVGGSATDGASCDTRTLITLEDESNYSFTSAMDVELLILKDKTDISFDWSQVTIDFFGHPMDAAEDVDLTLLSLWNMSPEELERRLGIDDLSTAQNKGILTTYPDGTFTSKNLLGFGILDPSNAPLPEEDIWPFFDTTDPNFMYPQDTHTFMAMISSGTTPGKASRMLSFFKLDPESANTELVMSNDSTQLTYSANLIDAVPVQVRASEPRLRFDWSQMTTNALGNEFDPTQITRAVVAHYSLTRSELEDDFLNLENISDGLWSGEIAQGTSVDLADLNSTEGSSFPGISDDGVWLLALFCTENCNNPAPWAIAVLEPCAAE